MDLILIAFSLIEIWAAVMAGVCESDQIRESKYTEYVILGRTPSVSCFPNTRYANNSKEVFQRHFNLSYENSNIFKMKQTHIHTSSQRKCINVYSNYYRLNRIDVGICVGLRLWYTNTYLTH